MVVNPINSKKISSFIKFTCLLLLLTTFFSALSKTRIFASPDTMVYVDPAESQVSVNQNFTINIMILDVYDLYGWEFKLKWKPELLDVIDVREGPFLKKGGDTFFTAKINNTEGYILVDCILLDDVPGVNGSGTLAYVDFRAEKVGSSILDLYDTILLDSSGQEIPHTTKDGKVTVSNLVGGISIPIDKYILLAPWIGKALLIIGVSIIMIAIFKYKMKKNVSRFLSELPKEIL